MGKQPRRHHYVPQFYLAGFSEPLTADGTMFVLDSERMSRWKSTPKGTAHKRDYHAVDVGTDKDPMFFEKKLAECEGNWAKVLRGVLETQNLPGSETLSELLAFVAFLAVRVPRIRTQVSDFIDRSSRAELQATFATPEGRERFRSFVAEHCHTLPLADREQIERLLKDDQDLESMADFVNSDRYTVSYQQTWDVQTMFQSAITLIAVLGQREWSVWTLAHDAPDLVCSDSPVCLTWTTPVFGPYSPGFGLRNTLVTVPLGKRLVLASTFEAMEPKILDVNGVAAMNSRTAMFANQIYSSQGEFVWLMKDGSLGTVAEIVNDRSARSPP